MKDPIVIVGMARTPLGNLLGALKNYTAVQLGEIAIKTAISRAQVNPDDIEEVIMGCVLQAGMGQAPARQAALYAGLPTSTSCTTINKMCGSGMKTVMLAHDILSAGNQTIMVAGGMESMTQAPYLLLKARTGYRLGHDELFDHMMLDGLEDAYQKKHVMGYFAERCAKELNITREAQDHFAYISLERAQNAIREKLFAAEIVPVDAILEDEHPCSVKLEKIKTLPPLFSKEGTITAANACSIADGAAACILMRLSDAEKRNIQPIAKIIDHCSYAKAPEHFPTAPIDAILRLLKKINWTIADVDLFEINEAFAVVALAAMHELKIPHEKLNIHGGACALGHPIGASGARILVTLISALQKYHLRRGIAAICIGGGEATAIAVEMEGN